MKIFLHALILVLTTASASTVIADKATEFSFALIGDMPYEIGASANEKKVKTLFTQINNDKSLQWVIHAGDIKTGAQSCGNEFLTNRKRFFDKFQHPFILTPGDNEWTDCHRVIAGAYDPLDRLTKLRQLFFSHDHRELNSITSALQIQGKSDTEFSTYVENIRWQKNNILFATIHLVGSENGESKFNPLSTVKRTKTHDKEVKQRNKAAYRWLQQAFERANAQQLAGVFITIHANPGFYFNADDEDRRPFKKFIGKLYRYSKGFPGKVVLAHGDTHKFRIDQPDFGAKKAPRNFIRVETFGEADNNWIKVTADPQAAVVFSFAPVLN